MISKRPPDVEDRAIPEQWEGDLLMGQTNRSAIGTLVERTTRYLMLLHLPDGHGPEKVKAALVDAVSTLPAIPVVTVTGPGKSGQAPPARWRRAGRSE